MSKIRTGLVIGKLVLYLASFSFVGVAATTFVPTASATCGVNLVSTCAGYCYINAGLSTCSGGSCYANVAASDCAGWCVWNVGLSGCGGGCYSNVLATCYSGGY